MRFLPVFLALFFIAFDVAAQTATPSPTATPTPTATAYSAGVSDLRCDGLPCGNLLWALPNLPVLASPTPINSDGSFNYDPPSALATAPGLDDVQGFLDTVGTFSTPVVSGTPYPTADYSVMTVNLSDFFGYVKAIQQTDFGVLSPLFAFFFAGVGLTILLKLITLLLPVIGLGIGIIYRVLQLIRG